MEPETIAKYIELLQSPSGAVLLRGFGIAVFSHFFIYTPVYEGLGLFSSKFTTKQEKFIAEYISYFINIVLGVIIAYALYTGESWTKIIQGAWWPVIVSVIVHVYYMKWLERQREKRKK